MSHPSSQKKNTAAGVVGNVLEWYDFALFGFLAPIVSPLFFPGSDPVTGLIKTYGIFAGGYLMRPLGGVVFSRIEGLVGRAKALQIFIAMMALPTALMGVLPTNEQMGAWAAVLLIMLRLIQGISVGGEMVGSMTSLIESAPKNRRGLAGSWSLFGASTGLLLASVVVGLLSDGLSAEDMTQWGWRVAFLSGGVLLLIGFWLPTEDEPSSDESSPKPVKASMGEVLRTIPGQLAHIASILLLFSTGFYTLFVWMPTYLGRIIPNPIAHAGDVNSLATVVFIIFIPLFGWLSDRVGYKPVILTGIALFSVAVIPMFGWVDHGQLSHALLATALMACIFAAVQGPMAAMLVTSVPSHLRGGAMGLAYNLSIGLFGGTAPLVSTFLIHQTGSLAAPGWYLFTLGLISLIMTLTYSSKME